jgi:hypothetical protein
MSLLMTALAHANSESGDVSRSLLPAHWAIGMAVALLGIRLDLRFANRVFLGGHICDELV